MESKHWEIANLSEIDIEKQGFLGVGDLNPILLIRIGTQVHGVHAFYNFFHEALPQPRKNPRKTPTQNPSFSGY